MTASSIEAPRAMQDAIPLDKVHPVPWVFFVLNLLLLKILISDFETNISSTIFEFKILKKALSLIS